MKKDRIISAMLGSVVAMAVTGAHCAYEKTTEEDCSAVRFSEYDGSENQLWTFKPADNSAEPEYRLVNVKTGKYLTVCSFVVSSREADAENAPTVFKALRIDGRDESPLYTFSSDAGSLSYAGGRLCADNSSAAKFRLLSFADGLPAALTPSGTYAVCCAEEDAVITDNGDSPIYVSRNAAEGTEATVQKWHIDFSRRLNGTDYFTLVNLDSGRYFAADSSGAYMLSSKNDSRALWSARKISTEDIPAEFKAPRDLGCCYRLVNFEGNTLYYNGSAGVLCADEKVPFGPSSTFMFSGGINFPKSGTVQISNIGGRGGEKDIYDISRRRFLQSVKTGYEVPVTLQAPDGRKNQKWLIEYVLSEERRGCWYKKHYYTVKNAAHNLYLTVKNGEIILADRDERSDYQLWNFFDMKWGWTNSHSGGDRFINYYCVVNKGTGTAMVSVNLRLSLKELRTDIIGGDSGASWLLNGASVDLGHAQGNNNAEKLVKSLEVSMLCYATGVYLEASGSANK